MRASRFSFLAPFAAALVLAALFAWSGRGPAGPSPERRTALARTAERILEGEREAAEREAWMARAAAYLDLVEGGGRSGEDAGPDSIDATGGFAELVLALERITVSGEERIESFTMEREGEAIRLRLRRGAGREER